MGHIFPSPLQPSTRAGTDPCTAAGPTIHRSVGVATIVALMKAHRGPTPASADLEERFRIDAWLEADMLPEESSAPPGSCDMRRRSR